MLALDLLQPADAADQVLVNSVVMIHALERFSAHIKPGEIVAIIGGSGCGKSTLLRAIAGLDRASSGTVTLDNEAISSPPTKVGR